MKAIATLLIGIVIGVVITSASALYFIFLNSSATEVWVSTLDLHSPSGIVIPAGTQFSFREHMPEGFSALLLDVNIEGEALDAFTKSVQNKKYLRKPVWLQYEQ